LAISTSISEPTVNSASSSETGDIEAVRALLNTEVDINAQGDETYGNPLQVASFWGHEAVVRLLLEKGAEVNAQGGECGNALYAA